MLRWQAMVNLKPLQSKLRDHRVWIAIVATVVLVAGLSFWAVRSHHRSQALKDLNAFVAFRNPALELSFPRISRVNDGARKILEVGFREGIWTLHQGGGNPASVEVQLTDQGRRWFSVVGNEIVATFKAGTREATRVLELEDIFPSRRVRFRYRWIGFHPATAVLGAELPEIGREYESDALLLYENERWRLMHWTSPELERALGQFQALEPASF